jgi:hypothetical protein
MLLRRLRRLRPAVPGRPRAPQLPLARPGRPQAPQLPLARPPQQQRHYAAGQGGQQAPAGTVWRCRPSWLLSTLGLPTPAGVVFDMDGTLTVPCIDFDAMRTRIFAIAGVDYVIATGGAVIKI